MDEKDLIKTLDNAIKFNGGVFKTMKQSSYICKMLEQCLGSEFQVKHAGIECTISGKTVCLEYHVRFADYGWRSYRRVGYVYEYDKFGVIRKWKLRYSYPNNGSSSHVNAEKTELVFERGQVNTEHLVEEVKVAALTSNYVAAVGQIVETQVTVKFTKLCHTNIGYGRTTSSNMVVMHDANGNELTWFGSAADAFELKQGDVVEIKGKVKAHKEYNGKKQTVLTRCKVLKVAE